jgi:hypothetical protein
VAVVFFLLARSICSSVCRNSGCESHDVPGWKRAIDAVGWLSPVSSVVFLMCGTFWFSRGASFD